MSSKDHYPGYVVILSLLLALVINHIPLPEFLSAARPAFVLLIAVYWTQFLPSAFGLLAAMCLGLLADVLSGSLLGQHALAFVLICYAIGQLRESMRMFPLWQQGLMLVPLMVIYEFVLFWIDGISGREADTMWRWLPVISTALCWPLLCSLLTPFRSTVRH
ncbi:MAG: rod shape-determining protein MreD [Salinisphaeraceae bacterium]|nr:rod shape-determining protein MreD [Salinisphaeraceae bacterium]